MRAAMYSIALISMVAGSPAYAEDSVETDGPPRGIYLVISSDKTFSSLSEINQAIDAQEKTVEALAKPIAKVPLSIVEQSVTVMAVEASDTSKAGFNLNLSMTYQFSDANVALAIADILSLEHYNVSVSNQYGEGC